MTLARHAEQGKSNVRHDVIYGMRAADLVALDAHIANGLKSEVTNERPTERRSGLLLRDAGGFALRCDGGETIRLVLHRVPVDLVEKRVTITGVLVDGEILEAEGVAPE